jgi:putative ABC transport system permease protein
MRTRGTRQIARTVRQTWPGRAAGTALQDLRYAGRSLRRAPGFAAIVVATLALGIGANLTMFSVMRAVLWRPLPYPEPERIVTIRVDARNVQNTGVTPGELLALNERSRSIEQVSTIGTGDVNVEYAGGMEHVASASVSGSLLPLLGVRPALGRLLDPRLDDGTTQALGAVISDALWRRQFGANPGVIGKAVRIDDVAIPVVGVLPAGFRLFLPPSLSDLEQVDVWLPWHLDATDPHRGLPVVARLRPGITLQQANAELETLAAQFEREHPEFYSGATGWMASPSDRDLPGAKIRFTVRRLQEAMTGNARPALLLLSGAVAFVLLIACVNVANLMLARGSARQRELEVRRALGATRTRIVLQLLTESFVLAVAAAAVGLVCADIGLEAIRRLDASHLPLQSRIGLDAPAVLAALALSLTTALVFGWLPAWRLASGATDHPLRAGRSETAGTGARTLQRTLVAAEVALSIVPLACAGLMLRSFVNLMHQPLGFSPVGVVTARVPLDYVDPQADQRWALMREVLDRIGSLPDVQAASAAAPLPLAGQETRRVGRVDRPDAPPILATQQMALPGYLRAIGTPLLEGRDFTDADVATRHAVTIVDEGLARQLWPEGAIGKILAVYRTGRRDDLEVVGVAAPVRVTRVRDDGIPHFMMPYNGSYARELSLVVRTTATAAQMAPRIGAALDRSHAGRAAYDVRPMTAYVDDSVGDTRFILVVLTAFAGVSLLLAAVGLYGTLSYLTARRTREFGIRLALGSSANAIVALVVRESVLLAAAGVATGLAGVVAATGAIRGLLYGVRPLDGTTLAAVVGLVAVVALAAAGLPAWRATRIDPQTSLRTE